MKTQFILTYLILSVLSFPRDGYAQTSDMSTPASIRKSIESINEQTEKLYQSKDIEGIMNQYSMELAFLPEYKPPIFESGKLTKFFTDWFRISNVNSFQKQIYTMEILDGHVVELGTFEISYLNPGSDHKLYSGNYLILWKTENWDEFKMVSHAMGSDSHIKLEDVPWAGIDVERHNRIGKHNVERDVLQMVEESDARVIKAVREGDGEARANGYTVEAILIPNFGKMYVGMDKIRPRMLKTYHSGVSYNVKHTFNRIYDLGGYVFVTGHYEGGWGDKKNGGWFSGNMTGLMKIMPDGRLKFHRMMSNRDSELLLFNN